MANLVNLEAVSKSYGVRPLLDGVSLGVAAGQRIGVVGLNGGGKTTLLEVLSGLAEPDSGRVSHVRDLRILAQGLVVERGSRRLQGTQRHTRVAGADEAGAHEPVGLVNLLPERVLLHEDTDDVGAGFHEGAGLTGEVESGLADEQMGELVRQDLQVR